MDDRLDTAPCGYVVFGDDGTILEINRTLLEILDHTRVDLLGWHLDKILPPGGRIFHNTYLFPLLKVQGRVDEIYLALRAKNGSDVPVLLNGVRREDGARATNECVCVRMIQRHAYEAQLLQARRLAEESNAAKARFLSVMSHDLRTPLTAIDGNAQLLEARVLGDLNGRQLDSVRAIREAGRTQMTMITDILEFARLDSRTIEVALQAISIRDVISRAAALVRVQIADAGLNLAIADGEDDVTAMADPRRLQQILLNLLTNASKFTPPGGEIAVQAEQAEDRIRIRVRDTGVGIQADDLPRIFAPFVQVGSTAGTSSAAQGVGLGLAISRDLARAMDGEVTVESTPGTGSIFTIDLPAATPPTVAPDTRVSET